MMTLCTKKKAGIIARRRTDGSIPRSKKDSGPTAKLSSPTTSADPRLFLKELTVSTKLNNQIDVGDGYYDPLKDKIFDYSGEFKRELEPEEVLNTICDIHE